MAHVPHHVVGSFLCFNLSLPLPVFQFLLNLAADPVPFTYSPVGSGCRVGLEVLGGPAAYTYARAPYHLRSVDFPQ